MFLTSRYIGRRSSLTLYIPGGKTPKFLQTINQKKILPSLKKFSSESNIDIFQSIEGPISDLDFFKSNKINEKVNSTFSRNQYATSIQISQISEQKLTKMIQNTFKNYLKQDFTYFFNQLIELLQFQQKKTVSNNLKNSIFCMCKFFIFQNRLNNSKISFFSYLPFYDPNWNELSLIYTILEILSSKGKYFNDIDNSFLIELISIFGVNDSRERLSLINLVLNIIQNGKIDHILIFKKFLLIFDDHKINPNPYSVDTTLSILIKFLKYSSKIRLEIPKIILEYFLPLITDQYLPFFQENLYYLMTCCIDNYTNYSIVVTSYLVKFWPISYSLKQEFFLKLLHFNIPFIT